MRWSHSESTTQMSRHRISGLCENLMMNAFTASLRVGSYPKVETESLG